MDALLAYRLIAIRALQKYATEHPSAVGEAEQWRRLKMIEEKLRDWEVSF